MEFISQLREGMHEDDKWSVLNLDLNYESMSDMEEEAPIKDGDTTNEVELHRLKRAKKMVHHYHKHLLTTEEEKRAFRALSPHEWFEIAHQKGTKRKRKLVARLAPLELTGKSTRPYQTLVIID